MSVYTYIYMSGYMNLKVYDRFIYIYIYMWYKNMLFIYMTEGSLEVKLPTIWTDGKAEVVRVREEKRREEKRRRQKIREEKELEERRCRCGRR